MKEPPEDKARTRYLDDLRAVCESLRGRRLLWRMMDKAGLHANVVDLESFPRTAFLGGIRETARNLHKDLAQADPQIYGKMLAEAGQRMYDYGASDYVVDLKPRQGAG